MSTRTDRSLLPPINARGAAFWLVAITAAALALMLCPRPAGAAPPEVKASENPVVIPYNAPMNQKAITLTWSLTAATPKATLTVIESGNPAPVLSQPVTYPPGSGTVPLTVTYGKTYTAQLANALNPAQKLGAPLMITTKHPDIKLDFGCAVQCITSVDVEPHGGWAQFSIKTSEQVYMTLKASTKAPNASGEWSNPADVVGSATTFLPTQSWTPPLPDLQPNTTYHYAVRAHDSNSNEQVKTGSFKTLTRRVNVTFAEIQMIDDSDGALAGDCDCFFWFNAGNEEPKQYGSLTNQKSIASGTTVHPNVQFTITNAPGEIRLRAFGMDDDTDFGEFCPAGVGPPDAHTGAANWKSSGNFQECLEWAGDQITVSVSRQGPGAAPGAVDEEFTEPFTIPVSGELTYKVHGTYTVKYVP